LIIVTLVTPIVIGAITLALISVFSLQGATGNRISDSADAQVVSSNFESDVQDSSFITTSGNTSLIPAPCETSAQVHNGDVVVLGMQMNNPNQVQQGLQSGSGQAEVTYLDAPSATTPVTYNLIRNSCQNGVTIPVGSTAISHAVPSSSGLTVGITCDVALVTALPTTPITSLVVAPLTYTVTAGDKIAVGTGASPLIFTATSTIQPPTTPGAPQAPIPVASQTPSAGVPAGTSAVDQNWPANCGANSSWISTASVTGVGFTTTGAGTSPYRYNLTAVPRSGSTSVQPTTIATNNSNCVFATGSGTYTSSLCFVDLSAWNSYNGSSNSSQCPGAGLGITANINRTADILTFCLQVQSVLTASPSTVVSGASPGNGVNGVAAVSFPTWSGAFLGNAGFYNVTNTQEPALYQQNTNVPKTTTVKITNIKVSDPSGSLATGWELVTGDAETTDQNESITWQSNAALNLLPNTPTSPVGNACESVAPGTNAQYLTGLGGLKVQCSATEDITKNGTVMLEALIPNYLTVTMVGTGLEGMFLGVMLPYTSS
jgi:hypothetical protein